MTLRDMLADAIAASTHEDADRLADELAMLVGDWLREQGAMALADAAGRHGGAGSQGFV
jgi:hypothetical protein